MKPRALAGVRRFRAIEGGLRLVAISCVCCGRTHRFWSEFPTREFVATSLSYANCSSWTTRGPCLPDAAWRASTLVASGPFEARLLGDVETNIGSLGFPAALAF